MNQFHTLAVRKGMSAQPVHQTSISRGGACVAIRAKSRIRFHDRSAVLFLQLAPLVLLYFSINHII